jgi:hypothetical protein
MIEGSSDSSLEMNDSRGVQKCCTRQIGDRGSDGCGDCSKIACSVVLEAYKDIRITKILLSTCWRSETLRYTPRYYALNNNLMFVAPTCCCKKDRNCWHETLFLSAEID